MSRFALETTAPNRRAPWSPRTRKAWSQASFLSTALVASLVFAPRIPAQEGETIEESAGTIDLEFAGGTLSEYIATVSQRTRDSGQPPLNVVIDSPEIAQTIRVPPIRLAGATPEIALELLDRVTRTDSTAVSVNLVGARSRRAGGGRPVYVVNVLRKRDADADAAPQELRVYSLREILRTDNGKDAATHDERDKRLESILSAVETALAMSVSRDDASGVIPAEMKYHVDTNLLFVRGAEEQHAVVEEVLGQVEESNEESSAREALVREREVLDQTRAELEQVRARATGLEAAIAEREREVSQVKQELMNQLKAQEQQLWLLRQELGQARANATGKPSGSNAEQAPAKAPEKRSE